MTDVRVELETCHHMLTFTDTAPPLVGDKVWCRRCNVMRTVKNAPTEYRVRCRRCTYSRMVGNARLTAERRASGHASRTGHPVAVYNGKKLIYVIGQKSAERDTPLFAVVEPPF